MTVKRRRLLRSQRSLNTIQYIPETNSTWFLPFVCRENVCNCQIICTPGPQVAQGSSSCGHPDQVLHCSNRCNHLTTNYSTFNPIPRNLNLLEYQSKGLLENYGVTVQKFKMASNADEVREYTLTKQLIFVNPCAHRLRRSLRLSHVRSMWSRLRFWLEAEARGTLTMASRWDCMAAKYYLVSLNLCASTDVLTSREVYTWPRTQVWLPASATPWSATSWSPSRLLLRASQSARLLSVIELGGGVQIY